MATNYSNVILGEGILYLDEGESGQAIIGYGRGATFSENATFRHIEIDGKKGNVKNDLVYEYGEPTLEVVMMEIDATNWAKAFTGMDEDASTPATTEITRSFAIASADYVTNVCYVAKTKGGKSVKVYLYNVTAEGEGLNLAFADKSEVEIPITFMANLTDTNETEAAFKIVVDES